MPSEVQRLHPISLLFGVGAAARNLLVPGIVVLVASGGRGYEAWFMLLFVPAVAAYVLKYVSYRYRLGEDEMVIREGIFTRNERHIPYARIQNIDLTQNLLHRLFGVAVVRLETASGGKPEAVIRVLSLEAVEGMRSHVFGGKDATATAARVAGADADAPPPLLQMSVRDVVLYGLISNRGLVVVAAAFGLLTQSGLLDPDPTPWVKELTGRAPSFAFMNRPVVWMPLAAVALLVALVLLMRLLSVIWALVKLYGFTLTRRGEDLRVEYGLFTRVSATIPRQRIQLLSVQASRLQRWTGRVSVFVETAGGGGAEDESPGGLRERQWIAPLLREGRVAPLVRDVVPEIDLDAIDWRPVERRAWRRLVKRALVPVVLIAVGAVAGLRWWGLLVPLPPLLFAVWATRRWVDAARWGLTGTAVLFRSGWWGRRTSMVRLAKIQSVAVTSSPFDRRARMASLEVDTAGAGRIGHRVHVPYLAIETARSVAADLYAAAGRTAFRW